MVKVAVCARLSILGRRSRGLTPDKGDVSTFRVGTSRCPDDDEEAGDDARPKAFVDVAKRTGDVGAFIGTGRASLVGGSSVRCILAWVSSMSGALPVTSHCLHDKRHQRLLT